MACALPLTCRDWVGVRAYRLGFMNLTICIAQLNFIVGDVGGQSEKIVAAAKKSHAQGAALSVNPELSLCGYAAEDLFLRPAFIAACDRAPPALAQRLAALMA